MNRHDWLVLFAYLGSFVAVLVILAGLAGRIHRNRHKGRIWAFLEAIRRYACDEGES